MADGLGSVVPFFQSISRICKKREPAKYGSLRSLPRRRKRAASNFASAGALLLFRQAGTVCAASSAAESKFVLSCSRQWRIVEMVGEWRITRRAEGRRRFSGGCGAAFASLPALCPAAGPYCPAPLSRRTPTFQPFFQICNLIVVARSASIRICSLTVHLHLNRRRARFPRPGSDRADSLYFRFARKSSRTFCMASFGSNFGS